MGMVDFLTHVISSPSQYFAHPFWLKSLWILAALFILYLIRPRRRTLTIPSLMFLLGQEKHKTKNSLFQKIANNLFWLLQTLAILALCLALAQPFEMVEDTTTEGSVAIVLDTSASMNAKIGVTTRFEIGLDSARKELGEENSIVLVTHVPQLILEDGTLEEALDILETVTPKATGTNIVDSLLFAGELMAPKGGRVVLVSDLLNTEKDASIHAIKNTLEARGVAVEFIDVSSQIRNVGIVDMEVDDQETKIFVKNYNNQEAQTRITVGDTTGELTLAPQAIETFGFVTPTGLTSVELSTQDEFMLDNQAYISAPESTKIRVLLISNRADQSFPAKALGASPQVEITRAVPPVIPDIDHDVVLISHIDTSLFLPSDVDDIVDAVKKNGAIAIVALQDGLLSLNLKELMPMTVLDKQTQSQVLTTPNKYTEIAEDTYLDFGEVTNYHPTEVYADDTLVLATDDKQKPLVAISDLGRGKVVYYGIFDTVSDFKYSPDYPLFWNNLVQILVNKKDLITELNRQTGKILTFESTQDITTPSGKTLSAQSIILNEQGIYTVGDQSYAVNLLNVDESEVTTKEFQEEDSLFGKESDEKEVEIEKDRTPLFLGIGIFLVLLELLYMKMRGDI